MDVFLVVLLLLQLVVCKVTIVLISLSFTLQGTNELLDI